MSNYYGTDRAVAEYLLFHYGADDHVMPWEFGPRGLAGFPVRCVTECLNPKELPNHARALDLGCAVGRATFELARHCTEVIGIDRSAKFIAAAQHLQLDGVLGYQIPIEGTLSEQAEARVPDHIDRRRVRFETGNALHLRGELGQFDVVLAANLVDWVPTPRSLLQGFEERMRPGGQLILTSPYTWLEEYTPRAEWLCAGGRPSSVVLAEQLPAFSLARRLDLPFVIREHARKFQWSVAEATVWRRH